jgi:hypothetical protein
MITADMIVKALSHWVIGIFWEADWRSCSRAALFGCHPTHPADRYNSMGLVWMIADAEVVAMGAEVVNLRKAAGTLQRVWKCPVAHGRIFAWDL